VLATKCDEHRETREEDYGPWFERATVYEHEGQHWLHVEAGYQKPYDEAFYRLSDKPQTDVKRLLLDPTSDCSKDYSDELCVEAVLVDEDEVPETVSYSTRCQYT
jgi:hypothetical protein